MSLEPEARARIEAAARRWQRRVIGALLGFTAAALLIIVMATMWPQLLANDLRPLRALLLGVGAAAGAWAWALRRE